MSYRMFGANKLNCGMLFSINTLHNSDSKFQFYSLNLLHEKKIVNALNLQKASRILKFFPPFILIIYLHLFPGFN